jgi:predicted RNA-binding protein with EMAP domain
MDMMMNFAMAYPGFAFAGAAGALWAARYVIKIKTENQHMKAETDRGERAAIMKIQDMQEILDDIEYNVRIQSNDVEEELITRQVSNLKQKDILQNANEVMTDSISNKESFHQKILDQFDELEHMLGTFDEVSDVTHMMGQMRKAFSSLQDSNERLLESTQILSSAIQANHMMANDIVKAVSE